MGRRGGSQNRVGAIEIFREGKDKTVKKGDMRHTHTLTILVAPSFVIYKMIIPATI